MEKWKRRDLRRGEMGRERERERWKGRMGGGGERKGEGRNIMMERGDSEDDNEEEKC